MKKLLFLFLSIGILLAGCEKNALVPDATNDAVLKSGHVKMVPLKGKIQSHVTESLNGIPVVGTLSGEVSHLGKLIDTESVWYTVSVEVDEQAATITWKLFGSVCAANGDRLRYTLNGVFSMAENKLSAQAEFNGGTGRFCDAYGTMEISGYADDPVNITSMFMEVDGMISYSGKNRDCENETVNQNVQIAEMVIEAFDTHDIEMLLDLFANNLVYTEVTSGRTFTTKEDLALYVEMTIAGLPDTRFEMLRAEANEHYAAVEWIWRGTNTVGWPYMGIPPTGNEIELKGTSVMEIVDGKIIWNSDYWDWATFMQQLGVE